MLHHPLIESDGQFSFVRSPCESAKGIASPARASWFWLSLIVSLEQQKSIEKAVPQFFCLRNVQKEVYYGGCQFLSFGSSGW